MKNKINQDMNINGNLSITKTLELVESNGWFGTWAQKCIAQIAYPINRGAVFYSLITDEQYTALFDWYVYWLNVTETKIIPIRPSFLDEKLNVNNMEVL